MASSVQIPPSDSVINVSIIDSTADLVGNAGCSVMPVIPGQPVLNFKTYVFLLEHPKVGIHMLFDGGLRKDWWNLAPVNAKYLETEMPGLRVTQNVNEILYEGGIDGRSIDAVIWSHHHCDHVGDVSLLPSTTKIVVGQRFKKEFMPGYPTNPEGVLLDSDFADRDIQEINFAQSHINLGGFRAFDYFGDGSLYLLDTPGHSIGHLSALVRTTPDTFILLGGDVCDAPQVWRPTHLNPLPDALSELDPTNSQKPLSNKFALVASCHRSKDRAAACRTPFSLVSDSAESFYADPVIAQQSVETLKIFDAASNVFVIVAHDPTLESILRFFPHGTINDWKAKGWKEATMWRFLDELPVEGQAVVPLLVDGIYRNNVKVEPAQYRTSP